MSAQTNGHDIWVTGDAAAAEVLRALVPGGPEAQPRRTATTDDAAAAVAALLVALGVPEDEHTEDTPRRVARAWQHALRGYAADPRRHLAVTFPGASAAPPPLVTQTGIRVVSTCAHHLLPITGMATVAYRPMVGGGRIVGLSKLARVVEEYAARATVQEVIGAEVAEALAGELDAEGAACIITAEHGCMSLRGVQQPTARTTTYSLAGAWGSDSADVLAVMAEHRAEVYGRGC